MHYLNRTQLRRAERLAEAHTAKDLGQMCVEATGKEGEVLSWAVWLRTEQDRIDRGTPTPCAGYSGRQTNRH